jgi:hypothetical protein
VPAELVLKFKPTTAHHDQDIPGLRDCDDSPTCRIEGVAPGRIYAHECIIIHDSASVLMSQRQVLRNLFI